MTIWQRVVSRISASRISREIDDEIQHHLDLRLAEYKAKGFSQREAEKAVENRFGDRDLVRAECRAIYRIPISRGGFMEGLWHDLRFAVRSLTRQPSFTVLALLTLAAGITASTVIFSALNSTILEPVPFPGGDRWITTMSQHPEGFFQITSPQEAVGPWREGAHTLEALATYQPRRYLMRVDGEPRDVSVGAASVELLPFLDVEPILGRPFIAEDTIPGRDRVALLSERYWRQRYGADREVLGKTVVLDDDSYTIVGVLPRKADLFWLGFGYPDDSDSDLVDYGIWVPGANLASAVGRLSPGVDDSTAVNDLRQVHARLGLDPNKPEGWPIVIRRPIDDVDSSLRTALWVLTGAVGFVLLVACVNVANMLLARGLTRRHELAVRTAVGARSLRIVREMVVESLLLTLAAAALALMASSAMVGVVRNSLPAGLADLHSIRIDSTVLAVTAAVAVVTGLLFGLVPVGQVSVINLMGLLSHGQRSGGQMSSRSLKQGALVAAQVALATVLLVGAALMVNSLVRLQKHDPGLNPTNVISFNVDLPDSRYADSTVRMSFFSTLLDELRKSPAVARAAIGGIGIRGAASGALVPESSSSPLPDRNYDTNWVSDEYLATLGMDLVAGREFSSAEMNAHEKVVIANESFARLCWPENNAVGRRFRFDDEDEWYTVVGVYESVGLSGLSSRHLRPQYFQPYPTYSFHDYVVSVRTKSDPVNALPMLKGMLWTLDPDLPMREIEVLSDVVDEAIALPRFNAYLLTGFAVVALGLAAVGVYGVVTLSLQHRLHELGVRVALGADDRDILGLMLGKGMRPVLFGMALGLGGALGLARFLRSLLFEVQPTDPVTYSLVAILLCVAALVACLLPARRAIQVDPVEVLRQQ